MTRGGHVSDNHGHRRSSSDHFRKPKDLCSQEMIENGERKRKINVSHKCITMYVNIPDEDAFHISGHLLATLFWYCLYAIKYAFIFIFSVFCFSFSNFTLQLKHFYSI